MERTSETKPVTIVAIGAGNRTNKYLEYAIRNPDRLKLVGVAELNDIRRHAIASKFGLKPEECFADYERFFENPVPADAILIGTPENMHFEPCMKAIEAGYNVLLEKPIAQSLPECCRIAEAARRKGVIVGVCHVLRYHPYFIKIKEIVDSGQLGEIISISHLAAVGLDRTTRPRHVAPRGDHQPDADFEMLPRHRLPAVAHRGALPQTIVVRVPALVPGRKRPEGKHAPVHRLPAGKGVPLLGSGPLL